MPPETFRRCLEMLRLDTAEQLCECEVAGTVVGAFGFHLRANLEGDTCRGEISLLVTAQGARGKGLGQAMLQYAEGLAHEETAHGFYQNLGYRITGYRFMKALEPTPP